MRAGDHFEALGFRITPRTLYIVNMMCSDESPNGGGGTEMADAAVSVFEQIRHTDEQGEYWLARELGKLLGYNKWQNFLGVIHEAMDVCRVQGGATEGLFTGVSQNPTAKGLVRNG